MAQNGSKGGVGPLEVIGGPDVKREIFKKEDLHIWRQKFGTNLAAWRGDITCLEIDGIVNEATEKLTGGGGINGAIHAAAGPELLKECQSRYPDGCPIGNAKITGAYNLPCKHILHTVGPNGQNAAALAECYKSTLDCAVKNGVASLCFCCIATGVNGYPNQDAAIVALTSVYTWLKEPVNHGKLDLICFCTFLPIDVQMYAALLPQIFEPNDGVGPILKNGTTVRIDGIESQPQINGTVGVIRGYSQSRGRYLVLQNNKGGQDQEIGALRRQNLTVVKAVTLNLTVPKDTKAGDIVRLKSPSGQNLPVKIPEGLSAGDQFQIQLQQEGAESQTQDMRYAPKQPEDNNKKMMIHKFLVKTKELLKEKKFKEAKEIIISALKLAPTSHKLHFNMGNVMFMSGDFYQSLKAYQGALHYAAEDAVSPSRFDIVHNLGGAAKQIPEQLPLAVEAFKGCVEEDPKHENSKIELADCEKRLAKQQNEWVKKKVELQKTEAKKVAAGGTETSMSTSDVGSWLASLSTKDEGPDVASGGDLKDFT